MTADIENAQSKKTLIVVLLLLALAGIGLWLIFSSQVNRDKPINTTQDTKGISSKKTAVVIAKSKKSVTTPVAEAAIFNPYEDQEIKAQLQQVSDIYAENIKYPITSQPVYNPEDVREYLEYEQSEVDLPFPVDGDDGEPIRISAATDRFQYFQGDVVNIRVQISNAPQNVFSKVDGLVAGASGDIDLDIPFQASDQSLTQFIAAFDTRLVPTQQLSEEMIIKLNVTIDGRSLATTVAFKYAIASAQINGVQTAQAIGPNLVMPLELNVFKSGYYFVNGVLEDAKTGQALLQLQAEQRLVQGNGLINLKAHISALRRQGSEGPYVLRSLRSYRAAEVGEQFDEPASSVQARFNIGAVSFSQYQDEEYVDELAEERLEFLRDIGSPDQLVTDQAETEEVTELE